MSKSTKNPAAVALGRLGGLKGGPALAAKMTPAQRKAAARKAALARWSKKRKGQPEKRTSSGLRPPSPRRGEGN